MRKPFLILGCTFALFLVAGAPAWASEVLDRIVATVNGHVVLQSDWEDAIRYEAFIAGHQPNDLTGMDRKVVLDRLIDQELLREQMHASDFQRASDEEIAQRIQNVRKQYPDAGSAEGWQAALGRYGLTEPGLKERVALQLNLMGLVDARLRPNVNIDGKSIESYYNQELLPELRQSGGKDVPLADVSGKIKELLTEQKVNELLVAWLQNLRSGSEIRTAPDPAGSGNQAR
jgi:peptidyl-prolyl cis-trans isomerase SurA